MTTRLSTIAALCAAAGLLGAHPARAQDSSSAPTAAPAAAASPSAAAAPVQRHAMVERRITELRSELKITPSEQASFDAFANVMRENASRMNAINVDRRKTLAAMSALDQMKGYQELAQAHAQDMERLVPAFEHLYNSLTPEQKKMADASFRDFARSGGRERARS